MSFRLPAGQHFGAIAKRYDVAGFTLTQTAYVPNLHLPNDAHERACFCLVLRGSYVERFGQKGLDCQPASLLFRRPGASHSEHFHNVVSKCFLIESETAWLNEVREQGARFNEPSTTRGATTWLAVKVFEEFTHRDEVSALAVQGLMLAAGLARAAQNRDCAATLVAASERAAARRFQRAALPGLHCRNRRCAGGVSGRRVS